MGLILSFSAEGSQLQVFHRGLLSSWHWYAEAQWHQDGWGKVPLLDRFFSPTDCPVAFVDEQTHMCTWICFQVQSVSLLCLSLYYCGILARHCTFTINITVRESHYVILPLWLSFYNLWISINRNIERAWRSWDQDKVRSNGQNSWYISWQLGRDSLFFLVFCLFSVGKLTPKDSFFWHY